MRFEYPEKSMTDENVSSHLGSTNRFGFYPIGRMNSWHGGLHLEGACDEIRAIADGKVIAYRIPKKYKQEVIKEEKNYYSNGMVLIQHAYKSPKGQELTFYSLYMHLLPEENIVEDKLDIPEIFTGGGKEVTGLKARREDNKNVYFVIPKGKTVELDGEAPPEHWSRKSTLYSRVKYKDTNGRTHRGIYVANKEKYVSKSGNKLTITSSEDTGKSVEATYFNIEEGDFDKVVASDVEIKAGAVVGYSGLYGTEKHHNYWAAHVEVFTPDDVVPFLKDAKKDGDEKNFIRVKQGAVLKKAYPDKLTGGGTIKIIAAEEHFSKVRLDTITKVVAHEDLHYAGKKEGVDYYHPKSGDAFSRLNLLFGGVLKSDSELLLEENKDEGPVKKRKVTFKTGATSKEFWIHAEVIKYGDTDVRKFPQDIPEVYEEKPIAGNLEEQLSKELLVKKNSLRTHKDPQGKAWYEVVAENKKGWIKEEDSKVQLLSAYNWEDFGFKVMRDAQDEYIYDADAPPQFLKDVWAQLDTDGNKVLTPLELQRAFRNEALVRKLSLMVCEHTSEWAYGEKWGQFKSKVEKLFEEGIKKEEDAKEKQELEANRKEVIDALEQRVKNLSWWNEVKELPENAPPVTGPQVNPPPIPIPASPFPIGNPKVFHFHPIAFVEQMRRVVGKPFIDWDFISKQEGGAQLIGYVPHQKVEGEIKAIGQSGVTIATGFDIGQHSENELKKLFSNNPTLLSLYLPYSGKKRNTAIEFLEINPLRISSIQAKETNELIHLSKKKEVVNKYNFLIPSMNFESLPTGVQTVVMSICFQYGPNAKFLNKMWDALINQDFNNLYFFFDEISRDGMDFFKRRKKEKDFLKNHLNS